MEPAVMDFEILLNCDIWCYVCVAVCIGGTWSGLLTSV